MVDASVRRLATVSDGELAGLAEVLVDCVAAGASVSFMWPFMLEQALAYWATVADEVAAGRRMLLVAEDEEGVVGTVQLVPAQPDNQPHRADVGKLLVHRRGRRRGVGAALMRAVDVVAHQAGKTVLVLDTADPGAERLYLRLGWQRVGVVPDFAMLPDGGMCATTILWKRVSPDLPELSGIAPSG
ncbi:MAG: GNAT family N-acetyltransferase [Acidimicrobiia bacterium]